MVLLQRFSDNYEGWLSPKVGRSPYEILDDPVLIKKKAEMRAALREEYNKRWLNPYRQAAGVGGAPFDPMIIRYNAMSRQQFQFFRSGPRFISMSFAFIFIPAAAFVYFQEKDRNHKEWKYRTGQVAYVDRPDRNALW